MLSQLSYAPICLSFCHITLSLFLNFGRRMFLYVSVSFVIVPRTVTKILRNIISSNNCAPISFERTVCSLKTRQCNWPADPTWITILRLLLRKEVIQPHLPIRLPCYDFTPVIAPTLDGCSHKVSPPASGVNDFRGVTGGVYKARERIHRSMLTCDY